MKIQELFDESKKLDREIESVVTFAASSAEDLGKEINEYVVTQKLHDNYQNVLEKLERAFSESSKEVGIWVSGFYGSGKSSFAKYLGYSFDKAKIVDGVSFGTRLMDRIQDPTLKAFHNTIISKFNPFVVMIDMDADARTGKYPTISDSIYYETLKLLGVSTATDSAVFEFEAMLKADGRYEEFCKQFKKEENQEWEDIHNINIRAKNKAAKYAPIYFPDDFKSAEEFKALKIDVIENEKERIQRLYDLVKNITGKDKIIFVLDEVGHFINADPTQINKLQGLMHTIKDSFKGDVWLIATAQQTLTDDSGSNLDSIRTLAERFTTRVNIEANDIKEIITKRLLGKSVDGKAYLKKLFNDNEAKIKLATKLNVGEKTLYKSILDEEVFANLYPFLPVHIDILMCQLKKLASSTGGVGLRSVIRLVRDILVDNHLADENVGVLANTEHFYDILLADMEMSKDFRDITESAQNAIKRFADDALAIRICKTVAIMQILDDFDLTFDNLCALLYNRVGSDVDKTAVRNEIDKIIGTPGVTLQEIDGKFRFMTNAILTVQSELNYAPREAELSEVMKDLVTDIFSPAPSVSIFESKHINASVELFYGRHNSNIITKDNIKINIRFVDAANFQDAHNELTTESTRAENSQTLYWICTCKNDINVLLTEIVRSLRVYANHKSDSNKEVQDYVRAQKDDAERKRQKVLNYLKEAQNNSEIIFRGSPQQVTAANYKTEALKKAAETIYNKYKLAPVSMKATDVTSLAKYTDTSTLPHSLNLLDIFKEDGSIDTSNLAFVEVKEFIAQKDITSGSEVLTHFDATPYGWSKETTRYLVATLLKACVIELRAGAKSYKVFSETAAKEMGTTTTFNNVGLSLNTDEELTKAQLIEVINKLKKLFNVGQVLPQKDKICEAAYQKICKGLFVHNTRKMLDTYQKFQMAGEDVLQRAMNYIDQIDKSEGAEAPALLLTKDCENAFTYAKSVYDEDTKSKFLDAIRKIDHRIIETNKLPKSDTLNEYFKKVNAIENKYNLIIADPDAYLRAAELNALLTDIETAIDGACSTYCASETASYNAQVESIKQSQEYISLKDEQKAVIDTRLSRYEFSYSEPSLENLRDMINVSFEVNMNHHFENIRKKVQEFVEANKPAVIPGTGGGSPVPPEGPGMPGTGGGSSVHETNPQRYRYTLKRHITTKADLMQIINQLQQHINELDNGSSIELELND